MAPVQPPLLDLRYRTWVRVGMFPPDTARHPRPVPGCWAKSGSSATAAAGARRLRRERLLTDGCGSKPFRPTTAASSWPSVVRDSDRNGIGRADARGLVGTDDPTVAGPHLLDDERDDRAHPRRGRTRRDDCADPPQPNLGMAHQERLSGASGWPSPASAERAAATSWMSALT